MPSEKDKESSHRSGTSDENASLVFTACEKGDVRTLGEFIIANGDVKDISDNSGRNALHYCVKISASDQANNEPETNRFNEKSDRFKCARIIMKTSPELIYSLDNEGYSPLHLAVMEGDLNLIDTLIEFHPSLSIGTSAPQNELSDRPSEQCTDRVGGRTAIHLAIIYEQPDILRALMQITTESVVNQVDEQGATALHYSVQLPSPSDAINILVEQGGADIDSLDTHGRTPLCWSATIGSVPAIRQLLKLGAKINIKDECGLAALHCAASRGHVEVVKCMLDWIRVANIDELSQMQAFRDVTDRDGCTPLFYSVTMGHLDVTRALLDAGAKVDILDMKGRSLAHCISRIPEPDKEDGRRSVRGHLRDLCQHGLDIWKPNFVGSTPLHEACLLKNDVLVIELSELDGFETVINKSDAQGHIPLHLVVAASWSSDIAGLKICQCLLDHGSEVNAVTKLPQGNKVTPLDLAIMNEMEEGVKGGEIRTLLERNGAKRYRELKQKLSDKPEGSTPRNNRTSVKLIRKDKQIETDSQLSDKSTNTSPFRSICACDDINFSRILPRRPYTRSTQTSGLRGKLQGNLVEGDHIVVCLPCTSDVLISRKTCVKSCQTQALDDRVQSSNGSTSVLVATPSSHSTSITEPRRQQGRRSQSHDMKKPRHQTSSIDRTNSHVQLIDRHLPAMIDRYLHDVQAKSLSREHASKCAVSPYLIPLIPVKQTKRRIHSDKYAVSNFTTATEKSKPRIARQSGSGDMRPLKSYHKTDRNNKVEGEYTRLSKHLEKTDDEYNFGEHRSLSQRERRRPAKSSHD